MYTFKLYMLKRRKIRTRNRNDSEIEVILIKPAPKTKSMPATHEQLAKIERLGGTSGARPAKIFRNSGVFQVYKGCCTQDLSSQSHPIQSIWHSRYVYCCILLLTFLSFESILVLTCN